MPQTLEEAREGFFRDCQLRAYAPGSYFWSGEHAVMYGHLAVVHAIPLYAYVGIEYKDCEKFEFDVKGISKETSIGLEEATPEEMEPIRQWYEQSRIEKYLEIWRKKNRQNYFKLKIWFQIPPKCGLNSSGAIAAALAGLLQILESEEDRRKILIKKINNWGNKSIEELKRDATFKAVFHKAWILDDCSHNFSSSGTGPFSSLVGSPNGDLLLYFTQKKGFDSVHSINRLSKGDAELRPDDFEQVQEKIGKIDWWGKKLPLKHKMKESLGMALIYCGSPKDTGNILADLEKRYKVPVKQFETLFSELFPEKTLKRPTNLARPITDFLKDYPEPPLDTEYYAKSTFNDSLGLLSWILVQILDRGNLKELAHHIIAINTFLDFYGVFTKELDKLYKAIKKMNPNVGIKLTGAGGGGDLVVLGDRDSIEGIENQIKKDYTIHFSTNRMGWRTEGLSVERPSEEKARAVKAKEEVKKPILKIACREEGEEFYVEFNDRHIEYFTNEPVFFALLTFLAAAHRATEGQASFYYYDIFDHKGLQLSYDAKNLLFKYEPDLKDRRLRRSGRVKLRMLDPSQITIDPSIGAFRLKEKKEIKRKLKELQTAIKRNDVLFATNGEAGEFWTKYIRKIGISYNLIEKSTKLLNYKFHDKDWKSLLAKSKKIFEYHNYTVLFRKKVSTNRLIDKFVDTDISFIFKERLGSE